MELSSPSSLPFLLLFLSLLLLLLPFLLFLLLLFLFLFSFPQAGKLSPQCERAEVSLWQCR